MPNHNEADSSSLMRLSQLTEEEIEDLKHELRSGSNMQRSVAFERLHQLLKDRTIFGLAPSVIAEALHSPDVETRRQASWAIGKMAQNKLPGDYPMDDMERLTEDEDPEVQENAAWAIGEMAGVQNGRERSITYLERLLEDDSFEIRGMAAWAIGRLADKLFLGNRSSLPPLMRMREDKSEFVRKSATFALERLAKIGIIPSLGSLTEHYENH